MGAAAEAEFRRWVASRRTALRSSAYLLCGDWYLADDLVQDALGRVYAAWDRIDRTSDPDAYARKVVLRLYLDHRRRPSRREVPAEAPEDARVADDAAETTGERDRLMAALRRVPPGQRAVLVLRYWEDLSVEQTAAALGTSQGNVKSQASRGLVALRAALEDEPADAGEA